jgi:hypothetical protein
MKKLRELSIGIGRKQIVSVLALFLVLYLPMYLTSESMTMTTYYPAPYGVYNDLRAADQVLVAYQNGASKLGVGTNSTAFAERMYVNGNARVQGNFTLQSPGGTVALAPQTMNIPGIGVRTFLSVGTVANSDVVFYNTGGAQKYLYYHCQWLAYIYGFPGNTSCPAGKYAMHMGPAPNSTGGDDKEGWMGCCLVRWI